MVVVSGAAKAQIEEISVWWAENRQKAPTLFDDEFSAALERLASAPWIGTKLRVRSRSLRRLVLQRSRYHVYYVVHPATDQVEILALWHTARGKLPRL
ncbi:MAG: type II toxin-antitoxin system RelE/ParE family toxin [Deltaproteobacteria bacterium]|jgi:plasmid stabilization system protein ParE|nr:type II toxin-antitoxin system RelE/ParE family toxin [Deltaproteobacteria bacterium]MBK9365833.1 type II toxin-antitoxin system RelE/ParE family toxin [Deltaproteobacteria bacterium]MBK9647964.1 type II toxin-antitoxin system RelE/ParE family toxin [Deltaproteobacteria bacterium]